MEGEAWRSLQLAESEPYLSKACRYFSIFYTSSTSADLSYKEEKEACIMQQTEYRMADRTLCLLYLHLPEPQVQESFHGKTQKGQTQQQQ